MIKKLLFKLLHSAGYYFRYTSVLHHPSKRVLAQTQVLFFNEEEKDFLEKSAASFNYSLDYSLGYRQKEQFLVTLNKAVVLGNSGAVVQDGKVVVESVFDVSRLAKSPAYKSPALLLPHYKKGLYTSVLHLPWAENNNYHWFFDCLPRLFYVLETIDQPINIIMRRDLPAYQHETLQFIVSAYPKAKVVYIGKHEKWETEQYILPSFVSNAQSGYLPQPISTWLREKVWKGYKVEKLSQKKRIYISRANAKTRRVLNETQLLPLLINYGFEMIRAEELTYQQQVQLFYNTDSVIAPHGAGLTNLLFADNCNVLELHPANLIKTHYFLLCKGLEFNYSSIVGSAGDAYESYSIELQAVEEWLQRL